MCENIAGMRVIQVNSEREGGSRYAVNSRWCTLSSRRGAQKACRRTAAAPGSVRRYVGVEERRISPVQHQRPTECTWRQAVHGGSPRTTGRVTDTVIVGHGRIDGEVWQVRNQGRSVVIVPRRPRRSAAGRRGCGACGVQNQGQQNEEQR